jgi:trk system potassium uptake protein TrkA
LADLDRSDAVAVIGLGRFGGAVADSLIRLGHPVLGIDSDERLVQSFADRLTYVVAADSTDIEALRQLGVGNMGRAVVGIGTDLEASVLSVLALTELEVADIWAKATSRRHGMILSRMGATHVIYPEASMGGRVAHLITTKMIDFIEFEDGFAIAKVRAPAPIVGRTLTDAALRTRFGVTVVGTKSHGEDFTYARPETVVAPGALLIVAGPTDKVERFAASA